MSADAITRAERLAAIEDARVRYRQASLPDLPYRDGAFDAVLVECVLSTTDREEALAETRRVLGSGGVLSLSDVTTQDGAAALPEPLATVLCLSQAWRPGELERLLPRPDSGSNSGGTRRRRSLRSSIVSRPALGSFVRGPPTMRSGCISAGSRSASRRSFRTASEVCRRSSRTPVGGSIKARSATWLSSRAPVELALSSPSWTEASEVYDGPPRATGTDLPPHPSGREQVAHG